MKRSSRHHLNQGIEVNMNSIKTDLQYLPLGVARGEGHNSMGFLPEMECLGLTLRK